MLAAVPVGAQPAQCDLAITDVQIVLNDPPVTVYEGESGFAFNGDFKARYKGTCVGTPPEERGCSFCASIHFQYRNTEFSPWTTFLPRSKNRKVEVLDFECTATPIPLELELELNVEDNPFLGYYSYRVFAAARVAPCNLDNHGDPIGPTLDFDTQEFRISPP
jgi:hypothetical protein